jgi:hypothetical protein
LQRSSSAENGHDLLFAAMDMVSPAEGNTIVLEGPEPMIGDGNAMSVAQKVV